MPLNDVRQVIKPIMLKQRISSHRTKATQNFFQHSTPDFISLQKCTSHSTDLNPLHYSVWDALQELVYQEKCEPFANVIYRM